MKSPSNECGSMLLLYLYINIPASLSYISKIFNALYLSNKGFDGDRYELFEIAREARFCNLYTLFKYVLFAFPP